MNRDLLVKGICIKNKFSLLLMLLPFLLFLVHPLFILPSHLSHASFKETFFFLPLLKCFISSLHYMSNVCIHKFIFIIQISLHIASPIIFTEKKFLLFSLIPCSVYMDGCIYLPCTFIARDDMKLIGNFSFH